MDLEVSGRGSLWWEFLDIYLRGTDSFEAREISSGEDPVRYLEDLVQLCNR